MTRTLEHFRATHKLCDVLSRSGVLIVRFSDGEDFELSGCSPIDRSIYQRDGGWCCTVHQYLGSSEKMARLFRPESGIDVYEQDIVSVADKSTGEVQYTRT